MYISNLVICKEQGIMMYTCNVCKKAFKQYECYKIHSKVHRGEKPFPCDFCNSTFCTRARLNTHRRMHMRQRMFFQEVRGG